jgi:hypothetical protein
MRTTQKELRESDPTFDDMRYDLAEAEAMNMDVSDIIKLLLEGFEGLEMISDLDIQEEWEQVFR